LTPRLATNFAQTIVWSWEGEAFGETVAGEDPDGDSDLTTVNLRFPGQYFDSESGLHYNYFRSYDPNTGRYVQSDPIGLLGGGNLYGYSNQNSLFYFDATGKHPAVVVIGGAAIAGAVSQGLTTAIRGGTAGEIGSAIVGGAILGAGIGIGAFSGTFSGAVIGGLIGLGGDAIAAGDTLGDDFGPIAPPSENVCD
jgi:RHS repeat-associated protein